MRFGLIRSPEQVGGIDEETFLGFLRRENNRHMMGFGRVGMMAADLPRLREACHCWLMSGCRLSPGWTRCDRRAANRWYGGSGPDSSL